MLIPLALLQVAASLTTAPADPLEPLLTDRLEAWRSASGAPGIVLGVALADGRVIAVASGQSDTALDRAMDPDDLLLMGSVGKTYVAATALQLVREGRLDLDALASRYLGGQGWFDSLPNAADLTVRQLMNHSSGLLRYEFRREFTDALTADPERRWDPREQVRLLHGSAAPFAPGTGWAYSDTNYLVLGLLLEQLTGRPLDDEIRERFLRPMGLSGTIASDDPELPGVVQGYAGADNPFGGTDAMLRHGRMVINPQFEGAGGGYAATARDAVRWGAAYFSGALFGEALLAEATRGVPAPELGRGAMYGLGMILRDATAAGAMRGHSGFFPGYLTELRHYPERGVTVVAMVNASNVRMRPSMAQWLDALVAELFPAR